MQTVGAQGKPRRKDRAERTTAEEHTPSREDTTRGKRRLRQYIHKVKNSGDNRWDIQQEQTRNNKESQRTYQNKKGTYSH